MEQNVINTEYSCDKVLSGGQPCEDRVGVKYFGDRLYLHQRFMQ
jgi:hypothetical protein